MLSKSQGLIADGIHSLSDLAADFVVLFAYHHGKKDADEDHPVVWAAAMQRLLSVAAGHWTRSDGDQQSLVKGGFRGSDLTCASPG